MNLRETILNEWVNGDGKLKARAVHLSSPELIKEVIDATGFLDPDARPAERAFCVINGIKSIPLCKHCTTPVSFNTFAKGYRVFCGSKCSRSDSMVKRKIVSTNVERYGGTTPSSSKKVREKAKATTKQRYQVEYFPQSNQYKQARKSSPRFVDNLDSKSWCDQQRNQQQLSAPAISEIVDCTPETVVKYLKKHDMFVPYQNGKGMVSAPHKKITTFLDSIGVKYRNNARDIIPPLEIDILVGNVGIEVNGMYFHSEKFVDKNYHFNKYIAAKQAGIVLLQFTDLEIEQKFDIITSIIQHKIHKTPNNIYARNTDKVEITSKRARSFMEDNHLSGFQGGYKHLGLMHDNQLVAVASLGKGRFHNQYPELIRYATRINTSVVGGFSKLLKSEEDKLMTYVSNNLGDSSNHSGKFIKHTVPGYVWYHPTSKQVISRYKAQQHKEIFRSDNTEADNFHQRGWLRVYDSGNASRLIDFGD